MAAAAVAAAVAAAATPRGAATRSVASEMQLFTHFVEV
jgi:hypothetical protein